MNLSAARSIRDKARKQFEAGDWTEAKNLYLEAEKVAWRVPGRWKDIAFFSLSTALRCYEEHLLPEFPEFAGEYERHAKRFFQRFATLELITPPRRYEAATFVAWRRWYHDFAPNSQDYFAAIGREDLGEASRIVQGTLDSLANKPALDWALKWQQVVWKSRRECLKARAERAKPVPDFEAIADAFTAAANVSVPPEDPDIPDEAKAAILFYQHMHRSSSERWHANKLLIDRTTDSLKKAEQHFSIAVEEARQAAMLGYDASAEHHWEYLSYWKWITVERLELADFSITQAPEHLANARSALEKALGFARSIVGYASEESIFPNRFYSMRHLQLEPHWISAFESLAGRDLESAVSQLNEYCSGFPSEGEGSWWHSNARVRLLAAKVVKDFETDKETAKGWFQELVALLDEEPCGGAANSLKEDVAQLLRGRRSQSEVIKDITPCWPIDAFVDEFESPSEGETLWNNLQGAPPDICRELHSPIFPGDDRFRSAWVRLLAILLQYYSVLPVDPLALLRTESRESLTARVLELPVFARLPEVRRNAVQALATQPRNSWHQRGCVISLLQKMPLVVHIQRPIYQPPDYVWLARPYWSRESLQKRRFAITVRSTERVDFNASPHWFLPPEYRKGNRPALRLKATDTIQACSVYQAQLRTHEDIDEMRQQASLRFEHLVRRFLQPLLPPGVEAKRLQNPEVDVLIDLDDWVWLGEIKFTESKEILEDDARKAMRQLQERVESLFWDSSEKTVQVFVTNSAMVPQCVLDWAEQGPLHTIWRVLLKGSASEFVETGDTEITAVITLPAGEQVTAQYLAKNPELMRQAVGF